MSENCQEKANYSRVERAYVRIKIEMKEKLRTQLYNYDNIIT